MKNIENVSVESLPDVLTAESISGYLNIGYVKALKLIRYGGIPYLKLGNTYRVSKVNFLKWLNRGENIEILLN